MAKLKYNFYNDNFIVYEGANSKKVNYKMPIMSTPLDVTDWANAIINKENEDGTTVEIPIAKDTGFLSGLHENPIVEESTSEDSPTVEESVSEDSSIDYNLPAEGSTIEVVDREVPIYKPKPKNLTAPASKKELINLKNLAMNFFISKGLTKILAAGIVGNLMHESGGLDTRAFKKDENAIGIALWRLDRIDGLKEFAKSRGTDMFDFNTQLEYVWEEMTNHDRFIRNGVLNRIKSSSDLREITDIVMRKYESADPGSFMSRLRWAERCLKDD